MRDGQLLEKQEIDKMCVQFISDYGDPSYLALMSSRHIPTVVIQGRYDVVCPVSSCRNIACMAALTYSR